MTAQPIEKLTKERVQLTIDAEEQFPGSQDSYKLALAQSWLEQYKALTRAAMWLDNDIDWQNPNPNEVKLLEMLRSVLP